MARSHKDRHAWKDKERNRTGKDDPAKVRLHRERFLEALKGRTEPVQAFDPNRYKAVIFQARLRLDPEEQQSAIFFGGQEIEVPFLVENPEDCHYALAGSKTDFDPVQEQEILDRHTTKALANAFRCHLEVAVEEIRLCSSIIPCKYRQFNTETGQAVCTLPRP